MRRPYAAVACCFLSLLAFAPLARAQGDANGDGAVFLDDVADVLRLAGGLAAPSAATYAEADVDADGTVTLADAILILRNDLQDPNGPLLPAYDTVTIAESVTRDYRLRPIPRAPVRYNLAGRIAYTPTPGVLYDHPEEMMFRSNGSDIRFFANVYNNTQYDLWLADGTYTAEVDSRLMDNTGLWWQVDVPVSPDVTIAGGDRTQNYTRPALPPTGTIGGLLTGPGWRVDSADFRVEAPTHHGDSTPIVANGRYRLRSAAGTGHLSAEGAYSGDIPTVVNVNWLKPITVEPNAARTEDVALAGLVPVTGSVPLPDRAFEAAWISLQRQDASAVYEVGARLNDLGDFRAAFPAGEAAGQFRGNLRLGQTMMTLSHPFSLSIPEGGGDVPAVMLPSLPAMSARFNGRVTRLNGRPVEFGGVNVTAVLEGSGWLVEADSVINTSGEFSLTLPAGTYNVKVGG